MRALTFLWFALFVYVAVTVGYFLVQNHQVLAAPVELTLSLPALFSLKLGLELWSLVLYAFGIGGAATFLFLLLTHLKGRKDLWRARRENRRLRREIEVLRGRGIEESLAALGERPTTPASSRGSAEEPTNGDPAEGPCEGRAAAPPETRETEPEKPEESSGIRKTKDAAK